jgi:hypothetical protein
VFDGNRFGHLLGIRVDPQLDLAWEGDHHPYAGASQRYSIRWDGALVVPPTGLAGLGIDADDGAKVWIDGKLVIEFSRPRRQYTHGRLAPGPHAIRVEYWNDMGPGHASLWWVLLDDAISDQKVPASALFHEVPPQPPTLPSAPASTSATSTVKAP